VACADSKEGGGGCQHLLQGGVGRLWQHQLRLQHMQTAKGGVLTHSSMVQSSSCNDI
jgi:hypothetical protein